MRFKNAMLYRIPQNWTMTAESLAAELGQRVARECGNQEAEVRGWAAPCEANGDVLVHAVGVHWLICMQTEERVLPGAVVKQEAAKRAKELEQYQGYKPGRKQMSEITQTVREELLPQAFVKQSRTYAWIDPVGGWFCINASSRTKADDVVELLRQTLRTFVVEPVLTRESLPATMRRWLEAGEASDGFTIDDHCELKAAGDEPAAVRYISHALDGDDVQSHLESGKVPTRLALTFDEKVSFVVTGSMEFKQIALLETSAESSTDDKDAQARFNSELLLMAEELSRLFAALVAALGGHKTENQDEAAVAA